MNNMTRREWIWTALAAASIIGFCIVFANYRGFWLDEYHTVMAVRKKWPDMVQDRFTAGHSPLAFAYAKLFYPLGLNDSLLRLSSALMAGVAVLGVVYLTIAADLRRYMAPILIFTVLQPYFLTAGMQYRYMMLLIAITGFLLGAGIRMARVPSLKNGLVLAILGALLLWVHPSSQFFLLALLLGIGYEGWRKRQTDDHVKPVVIRIWPLALSFVMGLPLLYLIREHKDATIDSNSFNIYAFCESALGAVYGDTRLWPEVLNFDREAYYVLLTSGLITILVAGLWTLKQQGQKLELRLLGVALILPIILIAAFQLLGNYFKLEPRYVSAICVPAAVCFGVAWFAPLRNGSRWALRLVIILLIVMQFGASAISPGDRHKEGLEWLIANEAPDVSNLACVVRATSIGLRMNGSKLKLAKSVDTREKDPAVIQAWIRRGLGDKKKALMLMYKTPLPLNQSMLPMLASGEIVNRKRWKISPSVEAMAIITNPEEQAWLDAVKPPVLFLSSAALVADSESNAAPAAEQPLVEDNEGE